MCVEQMVKDYKYKKSSYFPEEWSVCNWIFHLIIARFS